MQRQSETHEDAVKYNAPPNVDAPARRVIPPVSPNVDAASCRVKSPNVDAASCRVKSPNVDAASCRVKFFDPTAEISNESGNLPHWRQEGRIYFVTYRLADSIPTEKLKEWHAEREAWLRRNPETKNSASRSEFFNRMQERMEYWLDQGHGACILARPEVRRIVEGAFKYFHGSRYEMDEFVVMPNHVHALVSPHENYSLSSIIHSWKSFTANMINRRLGRSGLVWQKESFDHLVRSPDSLERFRQYIRDNPKGKRR